jgi:hypothetical protein
VPLVLAALCLPVLSGWLLLARCWDSASPVPAV